jgi:hypothetical protein
MTGTKYDYPRYQSLKTERTTILARSRAIIDRVKAEGRDLDQSEQAAVAAGVEKVKAIDVELAAQGKAMTAAVFGSPDDRGDEDGGLHFLSLRRDRTKTRLAARMSHELGGSKSLLDAGDPSVSVEMDPRPYMLGTTATSLLEILPAVKHGELFRWMKQTTRTHLAAPVAAGGLKPTSVYHLEPQDGRLKVIAHLSEPINTYTLKDQPSLMQFVGLEMLDGLHQAVETQLVSGSGIGENLTGLAATSGIQLQAYVTSLILTARAGITAVETVGYAPYYFVLNPVDWATIETSQLTAGSYVLNAEGQGNLPVDAALRRLWGVPVAVTLAAPQGVGYLISNGCVQVATDGVIAQDWSSNVADDWGRNLVRLRVESRFDLMVTRPAGVVKLDLTA